jgi:hypothetical protein
MDGDASLDMPEGMKAVHVELRTGFCPAGKAPNDSAFL